MATAVAENGNDRMNNIEMNMGVTTYRDEKPPAITIRFSANFKDETQSLAFNAKLIQLVAEFIKDK